MIVQAWNKGELAAARLEKRFFCPHSDLLDCFQAVHRERRTNNHQLPDTGTCQANDLIVRTGLQPGIDAQPRLESETEAAAGEAGDSHESIHCFKAVPPVTLARSGLRFTTVWTAQAVPAIRIRFPQMPLRYAVKAEQEVIVFLL